MTYSPPTAEAPALPGAEMVSPKSYATAVILSSVFGFIGVQHFYLGRWGEGMLDVGLTLGWICSFATGEALLGTGFLLVDVIHAFVVTIQLFTGNFKDGDGRRVCYPGQKLNHPGQTHSLGARSQIS